MDVIGFLGRFHPLLVHLPIGILFLYVFLEFITIFPKYDYLEKALKFSLILGIITAFGACVLGYFLYWKSGFEASMQPHMHTGLAVLLISAIIYFLKSKNLIPQTPAFKKGVSLVLMFTVLISSHLGASITHGADYLSSVFATKKKSSSALENEKSEIKKDSINPEIPLNINTKAVEELKANGFNVRVMLEKPLMLDLSLDKSQKVNLIALKSVQKNIIWLNISGVNLQDKDVEILSEFSNLEKLRLENNPITDEAVRKISKLKHLNSINLNGTKITSKSIAELQKIKSLKTVYIWQTAIKKDQIQNLENKSLVFVL
jgi:uncharacterized membrane protein